MEKSRKLINKVISLLITLVVAVTHIGCSDALANGQRAEYVGHIVDIENKATYPGRINVCDGKIKSIDSTQYLMPRLKGWDASYVHLSSQWRLWHSLNS